jgi:plastocyanin
MPRVLQRHTAARLVIACVALLGLALGLSACGGGGGGGGVTKTATGGKITVGAYDIRFDVKTIKASPGALTVTLVEHGALNHTFKIAGKSPELKVSSGKSRDTATFTLAKGTYSFECTVAGHAAQGMKGKIEVA